MPLCTVIQTVVFNRLISTIRFMIQLAVENPCVWAKSDPSYFIHFQHLVTLEFHSQCSNKHWGSESYWYYGWRTGWCCIWSYSLNGCMKNPRTVETPTCSIKAFCFTCPAVLHCTCAHHNGGIAQARPTMSCVCLVIHMVLQPWTLHILPATPLNMAAKGTSGLLLASFNLQCNFWSRSHQLDH